MSGIAGIKLHKTPTGKIKSVTIDVKKHGDLLQPLLEKINAAEKEEFEREWAEAMKPNSNYITPEQLRKNLYKKIDELWDK